MTPLRALVRLELAAARQLRGRIAESLTLMVAFLVAGGIAGGGALSAKTLPVTLWLAFTATLVHWTRGTFDRDKAVGILDNWQTSGHNFALEVLVLVRWGWQWLWWGVPVAFVGIVGATMLSQTQIDLNHFIGMLVAMLAASWSALGIALLASSLSLNNNSQLLPLLTLPFLVPVIIFGAATMQAEHTESALAGLAGLAVITTAIVPFATAAALRICNELQ